MNVRNVEIFSAKSKSSLLKKFILETNVTSVEKLPTRCHAPVSREFTVRKPPLSVRYVGNSLTTNQIYGEHEHFHNRNLSDTKNVVKPLVKSSHWREAF
jgi:hypothetical protein